MKKYLELYNQLKDKIISGEYVKKLPSEAQLISEYEVSRTTIRRAIDLLKDEGFVVSKHGKGVLIIERRPLDMVVTGVESFLETGKRTAEKYRTEIHHFDQLLVKKAFSKISLFPINSVVTEIYRTRISAADVITFDINYFSYPLTEGLTIEEAKKSVYHFLGETKQLEIETVHRKITVEPVTALDKKYLKLQDDELVAIIHNHVYTTEGALLEYTQSRQQATSFEFTDVIRKK